MNKRKILSAFLALCLTGCSATTATSTSETSASKEASDNTTTKAASIETNAANTTLAETLSTASANTEAASTEVVFTEAADTAAIPTEATVIETTTIEAITIETTTIEAITIETTAIEATTAEAVTTAPTAEVTTEASAATDPLPEETTATAPTYSSDPVKMVTAVNLNLRSEPSTASEVIEVVAAGTIIDVLDITDGWAVIDHQGTLRFLSAEYLSEYIPGTSENISETSADISQASEETAQTTAPAETTASTTEAPIPSSQQGNITVSTVAYGGILYTQGDGPVVCIDPGHMGHGSPELEPNAPGSSVMKARATTGTAGVATGMYESVINLQCGLMLRDVLLARGYNVMMTRESQDVDISNMERALMANSTSDIFVRIHCNSVDNSSVTGITCMSPSAQNAYVGGIYQSCYTLSDCVLKNMLATTGAKDMGVYITDTMSGINWSQIPVTIVEMGFMSNPTEDMLLCDSSYQELLVLGMANGIDAYFGR